MLYRGGRGIRWNVGLLYYLVLKVNTFSCLLDCTSYLIDTNDCRPNAYIHSIRSSFESDLTFKIDVMHPQ